MTDSWARVRELFAAASSQPAERRYAFLSKECGDDRELFDEVASLLVAAGESNDGLEPPDADALRALVGGSALPLGEAAAGTVIGPYRVLRVLGAGGMGVVYEAEQESPRRRVALKVMRAGLDSERSTLRFRYEAEILATLRHPGIATIHETGVHREGEREVPWFAMEFVHGARSIVEFADAERLDAAARIRLFVQVCEAVHHGHVRGVIHRDLKPDNILVDDEGRPRVIDFGVARATDAELELSTLQTQEGAVLGTLATMSPEQLAGDRERLDARTDVYSLGVVLYRLLCGAWPHDVSALPLPEAARVVRDEPPTRPGSHDTRLRGDLETILLEALEKEPARRYPSAAALAEDLERYLAGEPIRARPQSLAYQARLFTRRHRALVAASATVAVVALVAAAVSLRFAVLADDSAEAATRRYGIVRDIGRDLLYEVLDEMQELEGGSEARARVGETALAYLSALELEAEDDPEVVVDLYTGYRRVGMLLGGTREASLGRTDEAVKSLERALALEPRLPGGGPELARAQRRLRLDLGRLYEEVGRTEEARALFEEVVERGRAAGDAAIVGSALLQLGDLAQSAGGDAETRFLEAREVWGAADDTSDLDHALVLDRLGTIALDRADYGRAEEFTTQVLEVIRALRAAGRGGRTAAIQEVYSLGNLAIVADRRGEFELSRERATAAVEAAERLVSVDPENAVARQQLAWTLEQLGIAELKLAAFDRARASFARAAEIFEAHVDLDPTSLHSRMRAAELRVKESTSLLALGDPEEAYVVVERATEELEACVLADPSALSPERALCDALAVTFDCVRAMGLLAGAGPLVERFGEHARSVASRAPNDSMDQRRLMLVENRIGQVNQVRGADESLPREERVASYARAAEAYRACLDLVAELEERGFLYHNDLAAAEYVASEIERCEAERRRLESAGTE